MTRVRRRPRDVWSGQKVMLTGGSGFLGSWVHRELQNRGAEDVFVVRSRDYDLTHGHAVQRLLADVRPDVVIHLAAHVGGIGANRLHPAEFFYDNLMMGTQLIHESWRSGVKKLVAVGTVCSYPKFTPVPFVEDDLWNGYPEETNAPYGLAKKMLLVQAQAYRQQYGFNAIHLLPANCYGPGDDFDPERSHVIPALIRKCIEAKAAGASSISVWGDGSATREFLYAADAARGIVLAAERYDGGQPVNLGSAAEISIADLLAAVMEETGFRGEVVWDSTLPNGQPRRKLDTSRAETEFGFRASTSLRDGLRATIDWYRVQQEAALGALQRS